VAISIYADPMVARASVAALLLGVVGLVACSTSSDNPPQLGGSDGGQIHPPPGGGGPDGAAPDSSTVADSGGGMLAVTDGGTCATLATTILVTQQSVAMPTPQPIGGAIVAGVYVLTAMNMYTGIGGTTGPTSKVQAQVWQFDSSTYQRATSYATDGGLGAASLDSGYYSLSGTTFSVSATCGTGNIPVSYSVEAPGLKLAFANEEYVFTRQ
jgi:hypothetical protein